MNKSIRTELADGIYTEETTEKLWDMFDNHMKYSQRLEFQIIGNSIKKANNLSDELAEELGPDDWI